MIDDDLVRAHRNNIQRYHLLLQTTLTDFERQYVERRLSEEQSKLDLNQQVMIALREKARSMGVDEVSSRMKPTHAH